ncbi:molybdenum cofactor synthesis domain-containing protein [Nitratireductor aquibiodomus RA22]|uniref:Molybdopterin molybdenumtransferase n=1 Tax=Nitratireductor aquibiodomus RA22 TaxID=1189611 RepID=I5C8J2_9HYPH|nr:gephyrin-like molybdotransferase Glp [Nitratireductor aquibiodomus]EIM78144.1 molybdenum cofactor synthesis domain-containing protein [Nitratireductor aquibiodomus RA22]
MTLLPVDEALERILDGVKALPGEMVPIEEADGRVLAAPLSAMRTQPPFDASAMDGYAVRAADVETPRAVRLRVIGESAAGNRFHGAVGAGEAVRIFTGAPVPEGADTILIQENADLLDDGSIEATSTVASGRHIRRAGLDFVEGDVVLEQGRRLGPAGVGLAAAAGHAMLSVTERPLVAIIATGDELVRPGETCGPDQVVASNGFAIGALAKSEGARILDLGIVGDDSAAITAAVQRAAAAGAHVLVTLGGASVGARDLVRQALLDAGMSLDFWKIAMRPGKPLMFGRLEHRNSRNPDSTLRPDTTGTMRVLGLPGNPVSSLVCAHLFLRPLVARLGQRSHTPDLRAAVLASALRENDDRRDYIRASVASGPEGLIATPFSLQDSSMLTTLAAANALIVREPGAPAAEPGSRCRVLMLA